MTKYIAPFFRAAFTILGALLAYGLLSWLLGLIHPLVPAFIPIVLAAGAWSYFKVKDTEHEAEMAVLRAKTDESLAKFRDSLNRTFDVEADHTQCSDAEDDEAPLVRYSEHDPVQRI